MKNTTIHASIHAYAECTPEATAILGLSLNPLKYSQLNDHIQSTIVRFNELGVGRNDRVALVLPNGPGLAVAFLAITSAATCAPLNPAYTAAEFDFYLADLDARALVLQAGMQSPAIQVARSRGITILELNQLEGNPEGLFTLTGECRAPAGPPGPATPEDVALILHTSGTTSRPKMVPLTHTNLCMSAENIRTSLDLAPADRCLNIMPLFHIHGLAAAVLASLMAGASVACTPGFLAPEFFKWMETFRPTWYTAVPSMHQAILARAANHADILRTIPLRFVRSCSSALPPTVMEELERTFQVPVIEAYGMTEASHQVASNPLPPLPRKPGSVGLPAGPEIAIMAEASAKLMPVGIHGEIVLRGPNVTAGYIHDPEANSKSFTEGWFRTGDQGFLDDDGYLFITGRLKEIINRGGEKISPREIDEVFLAHPAVAQAVTFGLPDRVLGEDVAVAVVLKQPSVSEQDLRRYAGTRLAYHKVPRRVIILAEIPKGATGKIQRIGLAQKLGLVEEMPVATVRAAGAKSTPTLMEKNIAKIWQEVLEIPAVGLEDRFRDIGGDSLLAIVVHTRIEKEYNVEVPLVDLFAAATITDQAKLIEGLLPLQTPSE
ncbi:MAG: AMP-binding protein [Anaerolineales bacterium]